MKNTNNAMNMNEKENNVMKNFKGYAIRFKNTNDTYAHVEKCQAEGKVLWGIWKREGTDVQMSENFINAVRTSFGGVTMYALDQDDAYVMRVIEVLDRSEIERRGLQNLIPEYYNVNTPVYGWLLCDKIEHKTIDVIENMYTSNDKPATGLLKGMQCSARPRHLYTYAVENAEEAERKPIAQMTLEFYDKNTLKAVLDLLAEMADTEMPSINITSIKDCAQV